MRVYFLVASTAPAWVVHFHTGYARRSLADYSNDTLDDRFVHLTNASVQKKHASYKIAISPFGHNPREEDYIGKLKSDFSGCEYEMHGPGANAKKIVDS